MSVLFSVVISKILYVCLMALFLFLEVAIFDKMTTCTVHARWNAARSGSAL